MPQAKYLQQSILDLKIGTYKDVEVGHNQIYSNGALIHYLLNIFTYIKYNKIIINQHISSIK